MTDSFRENLDWLLRRQKSPENATSQFTLLKHNDDLLPKLQAQLEMILDAHNKFEPIVYDTQGMGDYGSDMVIRQRTQNQGQEEMELVGFQVKSFGDLSKVDCLKELKAQRYDSFNRIRGLKFYYILLCTDGKKHKDKIRSINAEFASAELTKVIDPRFAYTFLNYPKTRIEAFIKRAMQKEDIVLRQAIQSLSQPSPSAQALAIFLAVNAVLTGVREFKETEVLGNSTLKRVYSDIASQQAALLEGALDANDPSDPDRADADTETDADEAWDTMTPIQPLDFEEQITDDLSLLDDDLVDRNSDSLNIVLKTDQLRSLNAVITDALARYEYDGNELMSYMFALMGVTE